MLTSSNPDPLFVPIFLTGFLVLLLLCNAFVSLVGNWRELSYRAQDWLDRTVNPEPDYNPAHAHAYLLCQPKWSVSMELKEVSPSAVRIIYGGRPPFLPYDWELDGDGWPEP